MAQILGIDAANYEVKTAGSFGIDRFPSMIGDARELNLVNNLRQNDMIFDYNGRTGFAGTLASESYFGESIGGQSKAHEDTVIRVLLSLWRNADDSNVRIIVGQPITTHNTTEKERIKTLLLGKHTITVNGKTRTFNVQRVEVAAEGGAAFWSAPIGGTIRVLDIGSATINCASIVDKRYSDRDSFTINEGLSTVEGVSNEDIARGIFARTSKRWKNPRDTVLVCGGGAEALINDIKRYYPNARLLQPIIGNRIVEPVYANAVGFYAIGRATYEGQRHGD